MATLSLVGVFMPSFGYLRRSPKMADADQRIQALEQQGTDITVFVEHGVRGNVSLHHRPAYRQLLEHIGTGDTLYVWWFNEFYSQVGHGYAPLKHLLERGVRIVSICYPFELMPNDAKSDAILDFIQGQYFAQQHSRLQCAEASRQQIRNHPEQWQAKYKGRPANKEKHQLILQLLEQGLTLQNVAEQAKVSLSTVKRVKAKGKPSGHSYRNHTSTTTKKA